MGDRDSRVQDPFLDLVYILDETFTTVSVIDTFKELVWTERYIGCGDFEMVLPITLEYAKQVRLNRYIATQESETYMVIETIVVETDVEFGDTLRVKGRTPECYLDRRIIWDKIKRSGSVQDSIKKMLEDNAISPANAKRKIPGLSFKPSEDEKILALEADIEEEYSNLYDAIKNLCEEKEVGFRMTPGNNGSFTFELYFGVDRSWKQEKVPAVLFSNSYENLLSSEYVQSEVDYISTALVNIGENDSREITRKPERVGLARREGYFSLSFEETSKKTTDEIIQKAKEAFSEHNVTKAFDGEVDPYSQFVFRKDYFVGDIVQLENHYGYTGRCRITEVVMSRDASGPKMTPTFVVVEDDEVEVEGG